jgi:monofunctional glycosyltransferase
MNVAEFDEGVFGVEAAARHYYGVSALNLSLQQAAQLAAVLPNPKNRSAGKPSATTRIRATAIISGAQTIAADGRDRCFSG